MNEEIEKEQEMTLSHALTMDALAERIVLVDDSLSQQAAHAVNCMLTARNWFIGYYIVEFEQRGEDRAQYGEQLLKQLAERINRKGMEWRRLYEFRTFYAAYPQLKDEIVSFLQSQLQGLTQKRTKKLQPLAAIFEPFEKESHIILRPLTAKSPVCITSVRLCRKTRRLFSDMCSRAHRHCRPNIPSGIR